MKKYLFTFLLCCGFCDANITEVTIKEVPLEVLYKEFDHHRYVIFMWEGSISAVHDPNCQCQFYWYYD